MLQGGPAEWVKVKTTLPTVPYAPMSERPAIMTERLLIRPWKEDDLEGLHLLRAQPEVMIWSAQGTPDQDIEQTKKIFENKFSPKSDNTFPMAICLNSTGELIGTTGAHRREGLLGWPELGYQFKKEHWNKGYATECLEGFLALWWSLPRSEVELQVDKATVIQDAESGLAKECLVAITTEENKASQNVMRKSDLKLVKLLREVDLRDSTKMIDLYCHTVQAPAGETS